MTSFIFSLNLYAMRVHLHIMSISIRLSSCLNRVYSSNSTNLPAFFTAAQLQQLFWKVFMSRIRHFSKLPVSSFRKKTWMRLQFIAHIFLPVLFLLMKSVVFLAAFVFLRSLFIEYVILLRFHLFAWLFFWAVQVFFIFLFFLYYAAYYWTHLIPFYVISADDLQCSSDYEVKWLATA